MSTGLKSGKRRPRRSAVEGLRVMIWYQAVETALRLASAYAVELHLEPEKVKRDDDGIARPRKWDGYRNGKHTPGNEALALADAAAPGTRRWFESPVWQIFEGKRSSAEEVEGLIDGNPPLQAIAFPDAGAMGDIPIRKFSLVNIANCLNLEGLDLLEAVVLLFERSNLARSEDWNKRTVGMYCDATAKLARIPALARHFPDIFELIEGRYFPDVAWDEEGFISPWHVRVPELTFAAFDIDAARQEAAHSQNGP